MEVTQHRRLKGMVVSHYSKGTMKCIECGFSDMRALTIDHINGGGVAHAKIVGNGTNFYRWLKVHNYPEGYQVLCMNCQFLKRYDGDKYIAHLWNKG